jgi:hypothetical protein
VHAASEEGIGTGQRINRAWNRFWFTPIDALGLHLVRLLSGVLFVAWLLPFAGNLQAFFGIHGWVDPKGFAEIQRLRIPNLEFLPNWSILYLCGDSTTALTLVYWVSLALLALFTFGVLPRITAILSWVIVASFTANPAFEYEGDVLLLILAFYLMVGYLLFDLLRGGRPVLARLIGPGLVWPLGRGAQESSGEARPSLAANVTLRLLQVHFAIVIVSSGLHKLQFGDWWAGVALWFPLHPPFKTTLADAQANKQYADLYLSLLNIGTYALLAWQIGFPLFAWRPRWRPVLIGGAIIGWLATAFVWHLPLIGPAFLIGCLCFVSPEGWHRVLRWIPRTRKLTGSAAAPKQAESFVPAGQR